MGYKCRLVVVFVLILGIIVFVGAVRILTQKDSADYTSAVIDILANSEKAIPISDIFDFDFAKAYVFDDCYISGDGFTKLYDLDLSISEVKAGVSENIHRIVFVDTQGDLVYEFQYDIHDLNFCEEGVIIYPTTKIIPREALIEGSITLSFDLADPYSP